MWGLGGLSSGPASDQGEIEVHRQYRHRDDKHLRSSQAITGYQIEATDGTIGRVSGFMVDDRSLGDLRSGR